MRCKGKGFTLLMGLVLLSAGCITTGRHECKDSARVVSTARTDLLADLTSNVPQRQARARQLLPYDGVDAVPELLPLLANPDPVVAKNAYYVVLDIANAACAPGRESDRARVTGQLVELVKNDRPEIKVAALRILERVVPPDYDVTPIAALLKSSDAVLREKARATLGRINTEPALKALRAALKGADANLQYAILDALAETKDAGSVRIAEEMANHSDARLRLAAARVLAWTGDPEHTKAVESVAARADDATRKDATDALLRLAQVMETKDQAAANAIYARLLDASESAVLQAVAAGLARTGGVEEAERLVKLFESPDIAVRHGAIDSIRSIKGDAVTGLLLKAYAAARPEDKRILLLALGCRESAAVIEPLRIAAASDDPVVRRSAFTALAETGLPEALDVLAAAAVQPREGDTEYVQQALAALAEKTKDSSQPAQLTKAYRRIFELATDPDMRLVGLRGLAEHPSADLFDVAMKAAADDALKGATADLLVGVAATAYVGGNQDNAREALDALWKIDPSIERLQAYREKVKALGGQVDITPLLGGIRKWWIVGPFKVPDLAIDWTTDFVHEQDVDLRATYTHGDQTLAWKAVEGASPLGLVDLAALMGGPTNCYGYAYTEVSVGERQLATLRLGSDDGVAAWVNGSKVHDHLVGRGLKPDDDIVQIRLEPGVNKILLKISQGQAGWAFCARITDRDGRPLSFKQ